MSKFLHNPEKGCEMELDVNLYRHHKWGGKSKSRGSRCLTHECEVCFCGWQYGWHEGTDSITLKTNKIDYEHNKLSGLQSKL